MFKSTPHLLWQQQGDIVCLMEGEITSTPAANLLLRVSKGRGHYSLIVGRNSETLLGAQEMEAIEHNKSIVHLKERPIPPDGNCYYSCLEIVYGFSVDYWKQFERDQVQALVNNKWSSEEAVVWCQLLENALPIGTYEDELPSVLYRGPATAPIPHELRRTVLQSPNLFRIEFALSGEENEALTNPPPTGGYIFWDQERRGVPSLDVTLQWYEN